MSDDIDVTGCDLKALIRKAYELSQPQGLGFLHAKSGPLPDDAVDEILVRHATSELIAVGMDYVRGRAVKLDVIRRNDRLWVRSRWHDHTQEQLAELLDAVGVKHDLRVDVDNA